MQQLIKLEKGDLNQINKQTSFINKQKEAKKKNMIIKCSIIIITCLLIVFGIIAIKLFQQNKQLIKQINNDYLSFPDNFHSDILNEESLELFKTWLPSQQMNDYHLVLLYKATRDGCYSNTFIDKVKGERPTLIVIMSQENKKFGGYTEQLWNRPLADKNAFIFSLSNKERYQICESHRAIDWNTHIVLRFGTTDLTILDDCLNKPVSKSIPSRAYYMKNSFNPSNELEFGIKEIEVYTLKVKK